MPWTTFIQHFFARYLACFNVSSQCCTKTNFLYLLQIECRMIIPFTVIHPLSQKLKRTRITKFIFSTHVQIINHKDDLPLFWWLDHLLSNRYKAAFNNVLQLARLQDWRETNYLKVYWLLHAILLREIMPYQCGFTRWSLSEEQNGLFCRTDLVQYVPIFEYVLGPAHSSQNMLTHFLCKSTYLLKVIVENILPRLEWVWR